MSYFVPVEDTTRGMVQIGSLHHTKMYGRDTRCFYNCVCLSCGVSFVRGRDLLKPRHCKNGCPSCSAKLRGRNLALADGHAGLTSMLANYRANAQKAGREFSLTREEFAKITQRNCHYCDHPPAQVRVCNGRQHTRYVYNGIDRADNNKGYTMDNVVPCCKVCNLMKRELSVPDFITQCKLIAERNP